MEELHKILVETDEFLSETVLTEVMPENRGNYIMKKNDVEEWSFLRALLLESEENRHAEFMIDNDFLEKKLFETMENL